MKIFINQFCLSHGGDESPTDLSIRGERQVQSANGLRTAHAEIFPRGNRINTLTFTVTREHANQGAAEGFLFFHAATLPADGTLTFLCEDADGATVQYRAEPAAIASDQGTRLGITTTHHYTLLCGVIGGGELTSIPPLTGA